MNGSSAAPMNGVVVSPNTDTSPDQEDFSVEIKTLDFKFPGRDESIISDFSLKLPAGSRCVLLGENGAGKTTLLQLIAGQYMVNRETIRILGRPAFHDTSLLCSGDLSYLGNSWRRDIAFAGYGVALQGDFSAGELIKSHGKGVSEERGRSWWTCFASTRTGA